MKKKKAKIKKCAFGLNTNTSLPFNSPGRTKTIGDVLSQSSIMQQQANYEGDKFTLPMHIVNSFIASMLGGMDFSPQKGNPFIDGDPNKDSNKDPNKDYFESKDANGNDIYVKEGSRINTTGMAHYPFAFGGSVGNNVPVEVEGGEVAQDPNGNLIEFQGPSHKDGGIKTALPEGSEIYSKRILIEGKTIADRKKERELKIKSLEKKLKDFEDPLTRKTLNKIIENSQIEEEVEKAIQQSAERKFAPQQQMPMQKAPWGKPFLKRGKESIEYQKALAQIKKFQKDNGLLDNEIVGEKTGDSMWNLPTYENGMNLLPEDKKEDKKEGSPQNPSKDFFTKNAAGLPTAGDLAGIGGNIYQGLNSLLGAERNAATDTPNENPFLNFGKESMKELENSEKYISAVASGQERDLKSSRNAAIVRNRRSSRDLNTMRMGDYAVDRTFNDAKNQLDNSIIGQYMQLSNQKANLQQQIDQIVMGGEGQKDLANRQDKDARDTAIAMGKKDMGKMISLTGKHFNDIKERLVQAKYLNQALNFLQTNVMTGDIEGDESKAGNVYAGFQGGQRLNDILSLLMGWYRHSKQHNNPN